MLPSVTEDIAFPIPIPLAPKPNLLNAPGILPRLENWGCANNKAEENIIYNNKVLFFKTASL
jgi:hypothetical protein